MMKTRTRATARQLCWVGALLLFPVLPGKADQDKAAPIAYELVGQVLNASAQQSLQYGYLNFVKGIEEISTGGTLSESTARFTFYNDTSTERVINNGPMRVVDRTGTGALYLASKGADFNSPDSFRDGKVVQAYSLRHQVVIDTTSGYFTTTFDIRVTAATAFRIGGKTYRVGKPGAVYQVTVFGRLTQQGPPSAHIAGVAIGSPAESVDVE